ncbi:metal-sensing transcriptional repressor [Bacillus pseudomycoides]|uniref:metal-sensing transcriptional repressor n=1 Tax=Bacillus pseudomycoides TaxID=64104 RepID=UPI000BED29A0|nr:metal-sensing transcriptional repressor [Bacillus pseudomycoides]PED05469.1 transcriptional regulator [Bacillus pseudomycoides]PEI94259.1 transcriptional regulator [Bacillus pseudomycoides]PEK09266.1 transcriptional regulator [Bacillus pseudomycoides]PEM75144.1 transcriptional regulator [Bacillus pseudomycoides]PEO23821.1 transcriptional regulator [Bacillus pseudomycoides]
MDHNEKAEVTTHRSDKEKEQIMNRLKRIEGQVRGIQNMIENDRYCVDILVQVSAINAAMKKVGMGILKNHTNHCVSNAIKDGNGDEAIEELMTVFERFSKA